MALFTDGPIYGTIQIQDYENAILDVTRTESIDLDAKARLAQEEIGNEILLFLLRRQSSTDVPAASRRRLGLIDVAVTGPLQQWHALKTLALVYRDAYNNQLNDRYKGKWAEYEQLAKVSAQTYYQIGVGVVARPVAKGAGAMLALVPGSGVKGTYYVATSWTTSDGQEGSASDVNEITAPEGQRISVTVADPPEIAVGWNVYAGDRPDLLSQQNSAPISLGAPWTMEGALIRGKAQGSGQLPTYYVADHRVLERG